MFSSPMGTPHIVKLKQDTRPGDASRLARLSLQGGYNEDWLQELLDGSPDLLPAEAIDERIQGPLISLAREVETAAGYIDNLMISRNGYPVIVETKLWRNPEARRKVVAQVLDYAAQVRLWNYEELERAWRRHAGGEGSLWECVKSDEHDSESDWIDQVSNNLRLGRFTLLIVGDGIRTEARQLGKALEGHPDFQFRLGFVELRLFELDDSDVLVIPSCITRTVEVERAVIRIEQVDGTAKIVSVLTPLEVDSSRPKQSVLNEQAFLDALKHKSPKGEKTASVAAKLLGLLDRTELLLDWQRASVSLKYPDPNDSGIMFSLGNIYVNGQVGCWTGSLESQLKKAFDDPAKAENILKNHRDRARQLGMEGNVDIGVSLGSLAGREDQVVSWLEETIRLIKASSSDLGKPLSSR